MNKLFGLALLTVFILGSIGTVLAFDNNNIFPVAAYDMLDPESEDYISTAYILDVRTPAEWYWVGHPGKDKCGNGAFLEETVRKVINIPWYLWEYVLTGQRI